MTDQNAKQIGIDSVPPIEIRDGQLASSVSTIEECDAAHEYLAALIAETECAIDLANSGEERSTDSLAWEARARRLLRYKRAAQAIVDRRRGEILKERRDSEARAFNAVLADVIRAAEPKKFDAWVAEATRRCAQGAKA